MLLKVLLYIISIIANGLDMLLVEGSIQNVVDVIVGGIRVLPLRWRGSYCIIRNTVYTANVQ